MVSDIVLLNALPKAIQENVEAYVGCIICKPETKETIDSLGMTPNEVKEASNSVVSISVSALKQ